MAAFFSVWLGLACLSLSLVMVFWRPAFHDVTVLISLWFGCPGTVCLAGLVLWAYRKDNSGDPGVAARRASGWPTFPRAGETTRGAAHGSLVGKHRATGQWRAVLPLPA